jgi:hypothetical protein
MRHNTVSLYAVNALVSEPSTAFGVEERPDVAILCLHNPSEDWSVQLEAIVSGCIVLDLKKIILDLRDTEIATPFQIACIVSAWHLLIDVGGTLLISGLSEHADTSMRELSEPGLFNLFADVDESIDWLDTGFAEQLKANFPRTAKCSVCGTEGGVSNRGDHLCDGCGQTYLVTERGELPF